MSLYSKAYKLSLFSSFLVSTFFCASIFAQSGHQIPSTGRDFSTYEEFLNAYNTELDRVFDLNDVLSRLSGDSLSPSERTDIEDKVNSRNMHLRYNQKEYDEHGRPNSGQGSGLAGSNVQPSASATAVASASATPTPSSSPNVIVDDQDDDDSDITNYNGDYSRAF